MTDALRIVSRHLPEAEGSAAGRCLLALCDGFLELGKRVRLTSWRDEPPADPGALPDWCDWQALPTESRFATRARALARPRWDAARLHIDIAKDELPLADDPESWPALAGHAGAAATLHYSALLDARAVGPRSPKVMQDIRAQRRMLRQAKRTIAQSQRVAEWAQGQGGSVRAAPIALRVPPALPAASRPVAACIADWRWPPNQVALAALLRLWPELRRNVAGAELVIAGRGCHPITGNPGVKVLGVVKSAMDVLEQAAVLAFPCPPSSGPKVKVLEAIMAGRVVVTTPHGVEGVAAGDGAIVSDVAGFSASLTRALREVGEGSHRGDEGRRAAVHVHAPAAAAQARLRAIGGQRSPIAQ